MDDNFTINRNPQATHFREGYSGPPHPPQQQQQQQLPFQQQFMSTQQHPQPLRPQPFIGQLHPLQPPMHPYQQAQMVPQYQQQYLSPSQQTGPREVNKNFDSFDERPNLDPSGHHVYKAGYRPADQTNLHKTVTEQYSEHFAKQKPLPPPTAANNDSGSNIKHPQQSFRASQDDMGNTTQGRILN